MSRALRHHYISDPGPTWKGILGFGFYIPSFHFIDYPDLPSIGYFSAEGFDPPRWTPRVPNPAFRRARPDDTFWAARRVIAFTDEMIRAVVRTGQYSDPAAEKHVADTLIARRDAIRARVAGRREPGRRSRTRRLGSTQLRQRGGGGRCGAASSLLRNRLAQVRQCHRRSDPNRRARALGRRPVAATVWAPPARKERSSEWTSGPSIRLTRPGRSRCTRISSGRARGGSWWGSSGCQTARVAEGLGRPSGFVTLVPTVRGGCVPSVSRKIRSTGRARRT